MTSSAMISAAERPSVEGVLPAARPKLLPKGNRARLALFALMALVLLRGLLFGTTVPAFWAPDEDYHFLYMDYLVTQHTLPSPKRPLYPPEYSKLAIATHYDEYGPGPRHTFVGDPKASLHEISRLPASAREPDAIGRGVGVVHPPLYQLIGAAVDSLAGDAPMQTRLAWVRVMSAAFGVLALYTAWLLAAQVFRRAAPALLVGLLVATQPIVGFLSGISNHDIALIAFVNASLALMLFIAKTPPRLKQGLWLGLAMALALLVKGSALMLIPLAGIAFLLQGLTFRSRWREAAKAALLASAVIGVVAGWWYVHARIAYGSLTGAVSNGGGGGTAHPAPSIGQLLVWTKEWTGMTYRTYWWHFQFWEAQRGAPWYFVPALVGLGGILGLIRVGWHERRRLLDEQRPLLRQGLLMTGAILALYLSFLALDLQRRSGGAGFYLNGGRYLLPAYAAAAVLLVVGLERLFPKRARLTVYLALAAVTTVFGGQVYIVNYAQRYFGHVPIAELLHRMSFDRPGFVTPATIWILLGLIGVSFLAFTVPFIRTAATEEKPASTA